MRVMRMPDARVRWHCRRGMRELDELLMRYFDSAWNAAGDEEKAAFRRLLALSDPELVRYLLQGQPVPDGVTAGVIEKILGRDHAAAAVATDPAGVFHRSPSHRDPAGS